MSDRDHTAPLRVSLDVSAVPAQPVGVGRYTVELAKALATRPDVALTVWSRRGDGARWHDSASSTVRAVAPGPRPMRIVWEQVQLPRLLRGAQVDVHHGPHYTMPERSRVPAVVTVHDMTFFDHPELHERKKVPVFRRAIEVAARRAASIVCDSARTAARLEELCPPTGRVFVVGLGLDHHHFRPDDEGDTDEARRTRLGVQGPYILFLGTLEPRKAVPDLVAAFDNVAGHHPDISLVLAGRPGWGSDAVDEMVASSRVASRVIRTGYVSDDAVPALLRGSSVVAYPSRDEGFGLPVLEALACGAPVITTTGTPMAELAGSAAQLITAGSVAELSEALDAVLGGGPEVEDRRRQGLDVAARYSWEACAEGHMAAYRWAAQR